jgi:hypothetical protein
MARTLGWDLRALLFRLFPGRFDWRRARVCRRRRSCLAATVPASSQRTGASAPSTRSWLPCRTSPRAAGKLTLMEVAPWRCPTAASTSTPAPTAEEVWPHFLHRQRSSKLPFSRVSLSPSCFSLFSITTMFSVVAEHVPSSCLCLCLNGERGQAVHGYGSSWLGLLNCCIATCEGEAPHSIMINGKTLHGRRLRRVSL